MCGICGFVTQRDININSLKAMNDTMYHRGPDDHGEEIYDMSEGYKVGLAQRRLSILDLSPSGHQPMHSNDKRVSIVFNGEIYNFKELREQLSDYTFHSTCDTEVILASYLKWGIDCIEKLNGMFALCIYDRETQEIFLARDRIGKKPLYYWYQNKELVFASELKAIMACPGFEKNIRTDIIARYLGVQYIPEPDTVFHNVSKLAPGAILRFNNGVINVRKYWDVKDVYKKFASNQIKNYADAKEELKNTLRQAVSERMVADVPVGTFLSGGYDSSLISALAVECSNTPVKTYCIGFEDKSYNEAIYAKTIAEHLGTSHTEIYMSEKDMLEMVDSIPEYYDEPFADSSQIPSMLVSKLAKQHVTVVLSGDGGDEFFCGYNVYDKVYQSEKLDLLGGAVYNVCNLPGINKLGLLNKIPSKVRIIAENRNPETKTQLASQHYMKMIDPLAADRENQISSMFEFESQYDVKNWQIRRMLLDMDTYLPGDILCKVDRASMKYSLETRCPILDTRVMELSYRIPHEFKYYKGDKKHILKDIAYDYIPKDLLERPKKGFSVPIEKWLHGAMADQLIDFSNEEFLKKQGIFDAQYTNEFISNYLKSEDGGRMSAANYSRFAWAFLVFQMWYQKWMK